MYRELQILDFARYVRKITSQISRQTLLNRPSEGRKVGRDAIRRGATASVRWPIVPSEGYYARDAEWNGGVYSA